MQLGHLADNFVEALSELENGEYVFLGHYPDLPQSYDGADIDILVYDEEEATKLFQNHGWVIQRQGSQFPTRAFAFNSDSSQWIIIELWDKNKFDYPTVCEYLFSYSEKKEDGLRHPPKEGIYTWKLIKYLHQGSIRDRNQLDKTRNKWVSLDESQKNKSIDLLYNSKIPQEWVPLIEEYLVSDRDELPSDIWEHIENKRQTKHQNRIVFDGDIRKEGLIKNPNIIKKLIQNWVGDVNYSLPMISVVGNDGGGKTTYCDRLLNEEFYKTDPVHISFKRKDPILPVYRTVRPWLSRFTRSSWKRYFTETEGLVNRLKFFAESIPFWVREFGDFFDRYIRYKIGHSWSNAGLGVVIFERYTTDRLRGEYPGPNWSIFPLEVFIPLPHQFIHFDVLPEDSLARKPDDGHNLDTLEEKRQNYIRLLNKISPVINIPVDANIDEAYKIASQSLHDLCISKQNSTIDTATWEKDQN